MAFHGNTWEKKIVKLTYQSSDDVMSWESPYWDEPLESVVRGFVGLMVADGYNQESVAEELLQYAISNMKPNDIYEMLRDNGIEEEFDDDEENQIEEE